MQDVTPLEVYLDGRKFSAASFIIAAVNAIEGKTVKLESAQEQFFNNAYKELERIKKENPGKKYALDFSPPTGKFRGVTLNIIEIP